MWKKGLVGIAMLVFAVSTAFAEDNYLIADHLPGGLNHQAFEQTMATDFRASFAMYRHLDEEGRRKIYESYKKNTPLSKLRQEILAIYLKQKGII